MEVPEPLWFAGRGMILAALWLGVLAVVVVLLADDPKNLLLLILFSLVWIGVPALILQSWFVIGPKLGQFLWIIVVLSIIGAGEAIPALHRLDAALAPHRPALRGWLLALVGLGFALFMGAILHLIFKGGRNQITFAELKQHWQSGSWRDSPGVTRFFVAGGGVFLAITAGVALAVVFATPGLKLFAFLVWSFAVIRMWVGWLAANGHRAAAPRRPSGAGPRARS